jgi:hypothetical protein
MQEASGRIEPWPNADPALEAKEIVTTTTLAKKMFNAYNAQGPNPNKTYDGKDVPPWEALGPQVQGKWMAAAEASLDPRLAPQTLPPGVQAPSIGRVVHFTAADGDVGPYASMITAVNADGTVELCTFGRNSVYFQHGIAFDGDARARTWRWPPRV